MKINIFRWRHFIAALVLLASPAVVQAQFTYVINSDAVSITITGYNGPGGAIVIPNTINGYAVTGIGNDAFYEVTSLTSVAIPASVTSIGNDVFHYWRLDRCHHPQRRHQHRAECIRLCTSLTSVAIPDSVVSIGDSAFVECQLLNNVTIPNGVTSIGDSTFMGCGLTNVVISNSVTNIQGFAFFGCPLASLTLSSHVTSIGQEAFFSCTNLTNITIPGSVTSIGQWAFASCLNLTSAWFQGNAPFDDGTAFTSDRNAIVYYLPGTIGWGAMFGGAPTKSWFQSQPAILAFGVRAHRVSFTISWATNVSVIVQTCTNLANPNWIPVATNTLINGTRPFLDMQLANDPSRFYRVSGP